MKKIFCLILCFFVLFLLFLTSCDSNSENPNNNSDYLIETGTDYKIIKQAGECYIVFDDITIYQSSLVQLADLEFANIGEFKDAVTKGKLSNSEKSIIAQAFKKDDFGVFTCDFNELLEPSLPSDFTVDNVYWSGAGYSFSISSPTGIFGYVHIRTQEQYNRKYQYDYENFFDRNLITVEDTTVTVDGKTITNYHTSAGEFRRIRYTLSAGNRIITVDKNYRLNSAYNSLATSSSTPSSITLYCNYDDIYYFVELYGFTEDPTDQWLIKFNIKSFR